MILKEILAQFEWDLHLDQSNLLTQVIAGFIVPGMGSTGFQKSAQLLGIGIYSIAEASKYIKVPSTKLSRWVKGHGGGNRAYDRLWRPQIELEDGTVYVGFRDLVQSRFAQALIDEGLSPQKVRLAIPRAGEIMNHDHPFAASRLQTDGRTIFLNVFTDEASNDDVKQQRLIDLLRNEQFVMKRIVEPSLRGIEFEDDWAARWWPFGRSFGVVLDPLRQFGEPIDYESGIPVSVLSAAVRADGSVKAAARALVVPIRAVTRAVSFEQKLAA